MHLLQGRMRREVRQRDLWRSGVVLCQELKNGYALYKGQLPRCFGWASEDTTCTASGFLGGVTGNIQLCRFRVTCNFVPVAPWGRKAVCALQSLRAAGYVGTCPPCCCRAPWPSVLVGTELSDCLPSAGMLWPGCLIWDFLLCRFTSDLVNNMSRVDAHNKIIEITFPSFSRTCTLRYC